jgi:CHAT domain-containing protein
MVSHARRDIRGFHARKLGVRRSLVGVEIARWTIAFVEWVVVAEFSGRSHGRHSTFATLRCSLSKANRCDAHAILGAAHVHVCRRVPTMTLGSSSWSFSVVRWTLIVACVGLVALARSNARSPSPRTLAAVAGSRDARSQANALARRGQEYLDRRDFELALSAFRQSADLCASVRDAGCEARALSGAGGVFDSLGARSSAIAFYLRSLSLRQSEGDAEGEASTYNNLAVTYHALGNYDSARRFLERAEQLLASRGDRVGAALARSNIGAVQLDSGDLSGAIASQRAALAVLANSNETRGLAIAHANLGVALGKSDQTVESLDQLLLAQAMFSVAGDRASSAIARGNVGAAMFRAGRIADARGHVEAAISALEPMQDLRNLSENRHRLARILSQQGDLTGALAQADQAIAEIEQVRGEIRIGMLRATYLSSVQDMFGRAIDLHTRLSTRTDGARHVEAALDVAERARARWLLDVMQEQHDNSPAPALATKAVRDATQALQRAWLEPSSGVQYDTALAVLHQAIADDAPQASIAATPQASGRTGWRDIDVVADTALIEYWLGEDCSVAWIVTRRGVSMVRLPERAVIAPLAETFRRVVATPPNNRKEDIAAAARALAAAVVAPVMTQLPPSVRRLTIVADGPLHEIPFAPLPLPGTTSPQRMVDRYDIAMAPSLATARVWSTQSRRSPGLGRVAVLAAPVFAPSEPRGAAPTFAALPGTMFEADAIRGALPRDQVDVWIGAEANRGRAVRALSSDYDIVHLATHAIVDTERPEASALAFSHMAREADPSQYMLRVADLLQFRSHARLVVLSACDTGRGRTLGGEGIIGLTRSLQVAGVARVVATLWPIPDGPSTARLMGAFYRTLSMTGGADVSGSLRAAQRSIAQSDLYQDPYFWAPFTVFGS